MAVAREVEDDDLIIENAGVKLVIDPESAPLLEGAEIDYVDDLMKAGFTILNPNATSSCACGSSFQTAEGTTASQLFKDSKVGGPRRAGFEVTPVDPTTGEADINELRSSYSRNIRPRLLMLPLAHGRPARGQRETVPASPDPQSP